MRRLSIAFFLCTLALLATGFRRPRGGASGSAPLLFDFTASFPANINTTRSGAGTIYTIGATSSTATALGSTAPIWWDAHDGELGGILALDSGTQNHWPSPISAGTFASGAHASADYGSGVVYNSMFSWYETANGLHAARDVHSAGTVSSVASPWTGFGNAVSIASPGTFPALAVNGTAAVLTSAFTVEAKVKPAATGAGSAIFGMWGPSSAGNESLLFDYTSSVFECYTHDSGLALVHVTSTTVPTVGTTYDVACSWDGANLRIYVNGNKEGTAAQTTLVTQPALTWYIGNDDHNTGGGFPLTGTIDELRLSNSARYTGASYTPASSPFSPDANTLLLFHFDTFNPAVASGYPDPLGGTNGTLVSASETGSYIGLSYTVGGTGDTSAPSACFWIKDDATKPPSAAGGITASTDHTGGAAPTGSGGYRWVCSYYYKSGTSGDSAFIAPAGATITGSASTKIIGNNWTSNLANSTGVGSVNIWCPQITLTGTTDMPCIDSSGGTVGAVYSLDSSKYASVLQSGSFYTSVSFLEDPWQASVGGAGSNRYAFSYNNADGETSMKYTASGTVTGTINGTSTFVGGNSFLEAHRYYAGYGETNLRMYVTATKKGMQIRSNGCTFADFVSAAAIPTMHAPTNFYLGSNNAASTSLNRRVTKLDFSAFDPYATHILVIGDSIMSEFTTVHMAMCTWIYNLAEERAGKSIFSQAVIGDTIEGQQAKFDAGQYGTGSTETVPAIWVTDGVNNIDTGDSVASATSKAQTALNDYHAKQPTAKLYVAPITPCNGGCTGGGGWTAVQQYNACIAGDSVTCAAGGGTVLTCPAGATCHFQPANFWSAIDNGSGGLVTADDSGDHLHPNDLGEKQMGAAVRAALSANGDL